MNEQEKKDITQETHQMIMLYILYWLNTPDCRQFTVLATLVPLFGSKVLPLTFTARVCNIEELEEATDGVHRLTNLQVLLVLVELKGALGQGEVGEQRHEKPL